MKTICWRRDDDPRDPFLTGATGVPSNFVIVIKLAKWVFPCGFQHCDPDSFIMGLLPLEFTECLTDSPYFRENLHAHEKELEKTSLAIKVLIKEVKDLVNAARGEMASFIPILFRLIVVVWLIYINLSLWPWQSSFFSVDKIYQIQSTAVCRLVNSYRMCVGGKLKIGLFFHINLELSFMLNFSHFVDGNLLSMANNAHIRSKIDFFH